jgi:hypothetical protein
MDSRRTTGWRGSSRGSAGEFPTTPLVGRSGAAISSTNTIGARAVPSYNSVRLNDRKRTTGLSEHPVKTNENQSVNWVESELARRPSPKHIDLLPQDQNLGLKRSSRPEKIREHPPDQSAQVQHHATASPDSQSTTSRIWFAVGTGIERAIESARRQVRRMCCGDQLNPPAISDRSILELASKI